MTCSMRAGGYSWRRWECICRWHCIRLKDCQHHGDGCGSHGSGSSAAVNVRPAPSPVGRLQHVFVATVLHHGCYFLLDRIVAGVLNRCTTNSTVSELLLSC